jgi:PTS system nitrogen regulatory IIA component
MALSAGVRKLELNIPMRLMDIIAPDAIIASLRAGTKKLVLQELGERAARISGLPPREIFNALLQRERLGSTGTGSGVALPHAKLKKCQRIFGIFARLEKPIDFEAIDGEPVDLVLMLLAPEFAGADHLKALARVARVLRDVSIAAKLRAARDPAAIYAVLTQEPTSNAA